MNKLVFDFKNGTVTDIHNECELTYLLSDPKGFSLVGDAWLRAGWDAKYTYSFTWLGRPIIQQPEDMFRIQELIYKLKPDYIIDVGIAHGGSLIYYASLCNIMRKGKVIGVDVNIKLNNRKLIEKHELYDYIIMFEGDSINSNIIKNIKNVIYKNKTDPIILVILDGDHTYNHVLSELIEYSNFVSVNSYIIACDGYIKELVGKDSAPRTNLDWKLNNPNKAAEEFVKINKNFIIEEPKFLFNEGSVSKWISYFSGGFIKKIS